MPIEFSNDVQAFSEGVPGIYRHIPEYLYHTHPHSVSNSQLNTFRVSPYKMQWRLTYPKASTAAQMLGQAAHAALIEPDRFRREFPIATQCRAETKTGDRCLKIGSLWTPNTRHWFCRTRGHAPLDAIEPAVRLTEENVEQIDHMVESALDHPKVAAMLYDADSNPIGERELSVLWEPIEGVLARSRIDVLNLDFSLIADYKTTRSLSDEFGVSFMEERGEGNVDQGTRMGRAIHKWGYHRQSAFYTDALAYHDIEIRHFVFLVQEKEVPYDITPIKLVKPAIQRGRQQYLNAVEEYAECKKTKKWPRPAGDQIVEGDIPHWAYTN